MQEALRPWRNPVHRQSMMFNSPFQAAAGLGQRHLQTLLPTFLHAGSHFRGISQELTLPDGDFVDLTWSRIPEPEDERPVVVIFHGLEGSVDSPYALDMMRSLRQRGWHGVVMHFRGCSGRPNRLARSYHSGATEDARYLLQWLRERYPHAPLAAVGYSLGGNMLLKLQAELGADSPLSAAVSVSAPICLDLCADRIRQGFSRVYQHHLLRRMKQKLLIKYPLHDYETLIGLRRQDVRRLNDFWSFDDAYTAPMHGFRDVNDYYTRASARQYLGAIRKPALLVHALDDPFMPPKVIPEPSELAPDTELELSRHGGHVGFMSGTLIKPRPWLPSRLTDYLADYLKN